MIDLDLFHNGLQCFIFVIFVNESDNKITIEVIIQLRQSLS